MKSVKVPYIIGLRSRGGLVRDRLSRPEYLACGWLTTGGLWPSYVILHRGWSEPRSCKLTSTGKLDCVADQFDKHLLEQRWVELTGRQCANLHFDVPVVECGIHSASSLANPYDAPFEAVTVLPVGAPATMLGGEPFSPAWTE